MTRQDRFEKYFAESRGLEQGTITQYRFNTQDGYRLPKLAMAYRDFCAGMGAVVIELPEHLDTDRIGFSAYSADSVEIAIEAAGAQVL